MPVSAKKRLYLEALGITIYTDKKAPWFLGDAVSVSAVPINSVAISSVALSAEPIAMVSNITTTEIIDKPVIGKEDVTDNALMQLMQTEDLSVIPKPSVPKTPELNSTLLKAKENTSVAEQQNTLTAVLDVVLVQNNHGIAVVADVANFSDAVNNWNSTQEFLLDIARAATVSLFGDECDLSKAKAQKINGAMSVAGQLKSDKASADFLHGALLGPKNEAPKMVIMLGANAAFFTEFGEGRDLFAQRLLGESLPNLINSTEAKQALWQAIQGYVLGG